MKDDREVIPSSEEKGRKMDVGGLSETSYIVCILYLHNEGGRRMKKIILLNQLQESLGDILMMMDSDEFYAPPAWTFEKMWFSLEEIKKGLNHSSLVVGSEAVHSRSDLEGSFVA
mgnify:CR=1 FL=1